jgi:hypothetical protein
MPARCHARASLAVGLALAWATAWPTTSATQQAAAPGRDARPHADRYGDPLTQGAVARLGTVRLRQPDSDFIPCVAFSPDGKVTASAGSASMWEGTVHEKPYRGRLPRRLLRNGT